MAAADGRVRVGGVAAQVVADRCLPHLRQGGDEQVFCKELSDVLLQVAFHAWIERAERAGFLLVLMDRRPPWTGCRSASLPWPWPRSCSDGRRGGRVLEELARLDRDPEPGDTADPGAQIGLSSPAWS
jgi:hypothetical protein